MATIRTEHKEHTVKAGPHRSTHRVLRACVVGASALALGLLTACGTATDGPGDGTNTSVPQGLEDQAARVQGGGCWGAAYSGGFYSGKISTDVCSYAPTNLASAKQAHKIATTILGNILAGESTGCTAVDDVVASYATNRQYDFRSYWPPPNRYEWTNCSSPRVEYWWQGTSTPTTTDSFLADVDKVIDSCAGAGIYPSAYFAGVGESSCSGTSYSQVDPEPAQLTQTLSGSTGATAAAVFTDSQTTTSVRKWPSTMTYSATALPAGQPCSSADLASGATATGILVKAPSGNYWKCG